MSIEDAIKAPGWSIVPGDRFIPSYEDAVIELREVQGVPVLTQKCGRYPHVQHADGRTTERCAHVLCLVGGRTEHRAGGTRAFHTDVSVYAVDWSGPGGQQRRIEVASVSLGQDNTDLQAAVRCAEPFFDRAVATLATMDALYAAAHARIAEGDGYRTPLTRDAYERACAALGVKVWPDRHCGLGGVFAFPEYSADHCLSMHLAYWRAKAIEAEREAEEREAEAQALKFPARPYVWGSRGIRYDERCARCRQETEIDNETDLCRRCGGGTVRG